MNRREFAKGGMAAAAIRRILSIPEDETVMSVIALGKSAQPYFKNPRKAVQDVVRFA